MTNGAISYSTFQDRGTRLRSARRPAGGSALDQRSVGCSFSDGGKPISCVTYGWRALLIQMVPRPDSPLNQTSRVSSASPNTISPNCHLAWQAEPCNMCNNNFEEKCVTKSQQGSRNSACVAGGSTG